MKKLLTLIPLMLIATWALADVTEDSPHTSGSTGQMCLAVRNDAGTALAGTSGDYIPLSTDATGALRIGGVAATDLGKAEDAAYASGDTLVGVALCRNNAPARNVDGSTDYMCMQGDTNGKLWVSGTVQEDSGETNTDGVVAIAAVRDDALSANGTVGADGDFSTFKLDNYGSLWTHPVTFGATLTDTSTHEAAAYAAGDCLEAAAVALTGTAVQAPFLGGEIEGVTVTDLADQSANLDVVFFNADPGAVCASINAAFDLADDDVGKVIGVCHVTDHISLNDNSISQGDCGDMRFTLASGTALYYAVIVQGAPTYAGTGDLTFAVKVKWD